MPKPEQPLLSTVPSIPGSTANGVSITTVVRLRSPALSPGMQQLCICVLLATDPLHKFLVVKCHRNNKLQEELWEISVSIVKDFLSPEVLEKYGPRFEVVVTFLEEPMAEEGQEEEQHVTIEDGNHRVSFRASLANASDDLEMEEVCYCSCCTP